jgi:hypothetical protein
VQGELVQYFSGIHGRAPGDLRARIGNGGRGGQRAAGAAELTLVARRRRSGNPGCAPRRGPAGIGQRRRGWLLSKFATGAPFRRALLRAAFGRRDIRARSLELRRKNMT